MQYHTTAPGISEKRSKRLVVGILVLIVLLLIAFAFSIVGAAPAPKTAPGSMKNKAPEVSEIPVAAPKEVALAEPNSTIVVAPSTAQTALIPAPKSVGSTTVRKVTNIFRKTPKETSPNGIDEDLLSAQMLAIFSEASKPRNGQVLTYTRGKFIWRNPYDLRMGSFSVEPVTSVDSSLHVSGYGRKPSYPINAGGLKSAAGDEVSPERHYGGRRGGGGGGGGTTSTVTNITNTTVVSGGSATFIGTTPVTTYNGSFTATGKVGYDAANTLCATAFASSHMCTVDEILQTIASKDISTLFSGVADSWVAQGPPGYTADSNDCRGWTSSNLSHLGAWWDFNTSGGGIGYLTNCSTTKPIACCKAQ